MINISESVLYHETGHLLFARKNEYIDQNTVYISFNSDDHHPATTHSKLREEWNGCQTFELIKNDIKEKLAGKISTEIFLGITDGGEDDLDNMDKYCKPWIQKYAELDYDDVVKSAYVEVSDYLINNKDEFLSLLEEVKAGKWCRS